MARARVPDSQLPLFTPAGAPAVAERRKAEAALARRRERRRVKALALQLELEEEGRSTEAYLEALSARAEAVRRDERLDALLANRQAGKPPEEAIAAVERAAATPRRGR
jgi:hypothetical protein